MEYVNEAEDCVIVANETTYARHKKLLKENRMVLYDAFMGKNSWSGQILNNTTSGKKLIETKIGEVYNQFHKYQTSYNYTTIDKIHPIFRKRLKFYKKEFSSGAFEEKTESVIDGYTRNSFLDVMERMDDLFDFRISVESEGLKQPSAVEGLDFAVRFAWNEGEEYFYNHLNEKDRENKLTEAIIALSRARAVEREVPILDFCIRNISDKNALLEKLLREDEGVYFLLNRLINSCCFDTIYDSARCLCYKEHSDESFLRIGYDSIFSHFQT